MGEEYTGQKFKTVLKDGEYIEDSRVFVIIDYGERFSKMGILPSEKGGHAGNMSFRNDKGFVITAVGVDKGKLTPRHFVQVTKCNIDTKKVFAEGDFKPSSETLTHYLIYRDRKDVNAIVHVHDPLVLENAKELKVKMTPKEHPYGTVELAHDIEKTLRGEKFIAVRGHGVIAVGKSLWEAAKIIDTMHHNAGML